MIGKTDRVESLVETVHFRRAFLLFSIFFRLECES